MLCHGLLVVPLAARPVFQSSRERSQNTACKPNEPRSKIGSAECRTNMFQGALGSTWTLKGADKQHTWTRNNSTPRVTTHKDKSRDTMMKSDYQHRCPSRSASVPIAHKLRHHPSDARRPCKGSVPQESQNGSATVVK